MRSQARFSLATVVAAIGGLIAACVHPALAETKSERKAMYVYLDALGDAIERLRNDHVDVPDDRALIEAAIKGMLQALGEQNIYYTAEDYKAMQEQVPGKFGGLGIEVTIKAGNVQIVSPIDDGPAARAGLRTGDIIRAVDKRRLDGRGLWEAVTEMRGPVGSKITLKVERPGRAQAFDVAMVREIIHAPSVRTRVEGDVGYIRIARLGQATPEQLQTGVRSLIEEIGHNSLKGFVLDLRNSPGGTLDAAIAVADQFLEQGEIVSIRGRDKESTIRHAARPGDIAGRSQMVVLVNGGTAWGSEIVASALQAHSRARLIGTRTFGTGTVRILIPIEGLGGAMSIATARFHTPLGHEIEGRGIEPDLAVARMLPAGHMDDSGDERHGTLASYVPRKPSEDMQLLQALRLLRGEPGIALPPPGAGGAVPPTTPRLPDIGDLQGLDRLD